MKTPQTCYGWGCLVVLCAATSFLHAPSKGMYIQKHIIIPLTFYLGGQLSSVCWNLGWHSWWKYCPRPFEDRQSGAHVTWVGNRSPPADVSTCVCNIKSLHYPLEALVVDFSQTKKTKFGWFSESYCRFVLLTFSLNLFIYKFLLW